MRTLLTFLICLIANTVHAVVLSTIELPPNDTGNIGFGVQAVSGLSKWFGVNDAVLGQVYEAPSSDVSFMYTMVHNPSQYTQHGPLWVNARSGSLLWTGYYDWISYTHNDSGLNANENCCAMITGTADVLNVPWQAVTLVRTADAMTIRIYDTPTPEPTTAVLIALAAFTGSCLLRRR